MYPRHPNAADDDTPPAPQPPAPVAAVEAAAIRSLERRALGLSIGLGVAGLVVVVLGVSLLLLYSQEKKARQLEASQRSAEVERDVAQAVGEAEDRIKEARAVSDRPRQALAKLDAAVETAKRAEGLLKYGTVKEELKQRVQNVPSDLEPDRKVLKLLADLDDIRLRDGTAPHTAYAKAFKETINDDVRILQPSLSAKKLQNLVNREAVVDRLLDWADKEPDAAVRDRLFGVVNAVDPDIKDAPLKRIAKAKAEKDSVGLAKWAKAENDSLRNLPARTLCRLAVALDQLEVEPLPEVDNALRGAQEANPQDFWIALTVGSLMQKRSDARARQDALRYLSIAAALRPPTVVVYNHLGLALRAAGDLEGAVRAYEAANDAAHKQNVVVLNNLGFALQRQGKLDEAIAEFEAAKGLDPKRAETYINLGSAKRDKGDLAGAANDFNEALKIDANLATAHTSLGLVLAAQGDIDGAVEEHKKALILDPKSVEAHNNLGTAQLLKGDVEDALQTFQKALAINPRFPATHLNIGSALLAQSDLDGAIHSYQKAIELDPADSVAHQKLGQAFWAKGDVAGAIGAYRTALDLNPRLADAYLNLGNALVDKGQLGDAVTLLRQSEGKVEPRDPLYPAVKQRLTEYVFWQTQLDARLPLVIKGEERANGADDNLDLARMCLHYKHMYANAAFFYSEAFAGHSELANDLRKGNRFEAACAAVLAGTGQGEDNAPLSNQNRQTWRERARQWLEEDLAAWTKIGSSEKWGDRLSVRNALLRWKQEHCLVAVRNKEALQKLSEGERAYWQKLWDDVDALLNQLRQKK